MYNYNTEDSIYLYTEDYLNFILDRRCSDNRQFDLLYHLFGLKKQLDTRSLSEEYHKKFDWLFVEYLTNPTKRMFAMDKTSGKWGTPNNDTHHIVYFIREELCKNCFINISDLLGGKDLLDIAELLARHPDNASETERIFRSYLRRVSTGTTWDELYNRVKNEITYCNRDYNKHRLTLLCILMGVIMIKLHHDKDETQYVETYIKKWDLFKHFFSVMTGKIVGCDFTHINAVIGNFLGIQREYAWAMKIAVEYSKDKLKRDMNEKGRMNLDDLLSRLGAKANEVEQDTSISELFSILFPKAEWESYNNAAPRRTAAETQRLIEEKEKMLNEWKNRVEQLEQEIEELRPLKELVEKMRGALRGKMISVESLSNAILSYPPKVAKELFSQLDWYLDGHDETWDDIRHELKKKITEKENQSEDAKVINTQAYYAAGAQHRDITMTGSNATYNENNNNNNIREDNGEKNTDDRR